MGALPRGRTHACADAVFPSRDAGARGCAGVLNRSVTGARLVRGLAEMDRVVGTSRGAADDSPAA
jgi:hypothetical protein